MLNVLLTVDTEVYARTADWRKQGLRSDINRDIYGVVDGGEVGLDYQLRVLERYSLKAVFMIGSLFAAVPEVGIAPLREIVSRIKAGGHEIQLHTHPDWIEHVDLGVPFRGDLLSSYSESEQQQLITLGAQLLTEAGAAAPTAFRGGDYSANLDTIRALKTCGIKLDSSYNVDYSATNCNLPWNGSVGTAYMIEGVQELPIAAFRDFQTHLRPAQLCACSSREMQHAIRQAEREGWDFFVIVSHSFELTGRRWHPKRSPIVRKSVVQRFDRLCAWLANHRESYRTVGFADFEPRRNAPVTAPVKGNLRNTIQRTVQQANDRLAVRFAHLTPAQLFTKPSTPEPNRFHRNATRMDLEAGSPGTEICEERQAS